MRTGAFLGSCAQVRRSPLPGVACGPGPTNGISCLKSFPAPCPPLPLPPLRHAPSWLRASRAGGTAPPTPPWPGASSRRGSGGWWPSWSETCGRSGPGPGPSAGSPTKPRPRGVRGRAEKDRVMQWGRRKGRGWVLCEGGGRGKGGGTVDTSLPLKRWLLLVCTCPAGNVVKITWPGPHGHGGRAGGGGERAGGPGRQGPGWQGRRGRERCRRRRGRRRRRRGRR